MRPGLLPALLLAAAWLAAASVTTSCTSTRACKTNTLLVTVTLDSAAAMADKLAIAVTVGSGAPTMSTLNHTPGQASGTVEVDFPNGYPKGQKVNVAVTATQRRRDGRQRQRRQRAQRRLRGGLGVGHR